MYRLIDVKEKKDKKDFVEFPKKLYGKDRRQNLKEEKQLLNNKHILCKYFDFYPFILKKDNTIVARCAVTIYKDNKEEAYIGFYECIYDKEASNYLLAKVEEFLKEKGITKITGPVDASFWIRYRFKTNKFEKTPYSGEPYNKEYYVNFWKESGYRIANHYSSNIFSKVTINDLNEKLRKRKEEMIEKGYVIKNAKYKNFDEELKEIYKLLIVVYSEFPTFKHITEEEFLKMYHKLKYILNFDMVKLAYKNNELVAFFICIPNYGKMRIIDLIKTKIKTTEYILMYLGTDKKHPGMGTALTECVFEELCKNQCTSIGALIMDRKISGNYYKEIVKEKYEYVLLEKNI